MVLVAGASPALTASAPRAESGSRKAPVPAILSVVESSAEDLVDDALASDRAAVVRGASELRSAANGSDVRALGRSGVPGSQIADLGRRADRVWRLARAGSFVDVALAANGVSQLMPDLYARFRDPVPPAILRLDYLDREVELRSIARQPGRVAGAIRELERTWPRVQPKVIAAGGARQAADYRRHVNALRRLPPDARERLRSEAARGLELVDELERVFTG